MSKLSNLSDKDIHEAIEAMQNGIAIKPNGEEARVLQRSIDRALEELKRRAEQKKSDPQPIEKIEQLPKKAEMQEWANKEEQQAQVEKEKFEATMKRGELMGTEKPSERFKKSLDRIESAKAFDVKENRVTVGHVTEVPVINIPVVKIEIGGEDKFLNRTEIIGYLKTYFKRIAMNDKMSAGLYSELYGSEMGKTTYKLFQGWNIIYNETKEGAAWPPLEDVFPGLYRASQQHKVNADVLWRWASNDKQ